MKIVRLLTVCATLAAGAGALQAQSSAAEEQAIRKVLRRMSDALDARDFKAFGQFFAEDAEFVNVTATLAKGRDAIVELHVKSQNGVFKGIDWKSFEAQMPERVIAVRFLRPDVAIAHNQLDPGECPPCIAASAAMRGPKPTKGSRQVMSCVLSKHGDQWLIDLVQNNVWIRPDTPATPPK